MGTTGQGRNAKHGVTEWRSATHVAQPPKSAPASTAHAPYSWIVLVIAVLVASVAAYWRGVRFRSDQTWGVIISVGAAFISVSALPSPTGTIIGCVFVALGTAEAIAAERRSIVADRLQALTENLMRSELRGQLRALADRLFILRLELIAVEPRPGTEKEPVNPFTVSDVTLPHGWHVVVDTKEHVYARHLNATAQTLESNIVRDLETLYDKVQHYGLSDPEIAQFIKERRSTKGVEYHLEELSLHLKALADRLQNVELD